MSGSTVTIQPPPKPLPRLLATVELAQPLEALERRLLHWASAAGWSIKTIADFETLARVFEHQPVLGCEDTALDLRLAIDAWEALRRRPDAGFLGYVQIWQARLATQIALGVGDEGRLRALQQQLGGILIDSREAPYLLVLPQPDGTYVLLGFESVVWQDRSPFAANRHAARILRLHELPASERAYIRTD